MPFTEAGRLSELAQSQSYVRPPGDERTRFEIASSLCPFALFFRSVLRQDGWDSAADAFEASELKTPVYSRDTPTIYADGHLADPRYGCEPREPNNPIEPARNRDSALDSGRRGWFLPDTAIVAAPPRI